MKNSHLNKTIFIVVALVALSCQLYSQDETVLIYHGGDTKSGIITDKNPQEKTHVDVKSRYKITQNKDDVVRIEVWNPNPYFYKYSIKTKNVDPPKPPAELEKLSAIVDAVVPSGIIPKTKTEIKDDKLKSNIQALDGSNPTIEDNIILPIINAYNNAIKNNIDTLNKMIQIINDSKRAESIDKLPVGNSTTTYGFKDTKAKLNDSEFERYRNKEGFNKILDEEFQQLSTKLLDTLKNLKGKDSKNEKTYIEFETLFKDLILPALKEYPKTLMAESHQDIVKFINTPQTPVYFDVVVPEEGIEIVIITDEIRSPKDGTRDTAIIAHINITTEYVRPVLEIVPLLYMVSKPNTKSFSIKDSAVIETQGDYFDFRIGSVLMMNFFTWDSFALGIGVGSNLGIGTEWNVDLLAIVGLSYRDWLRVGVGFSRAFIPSKLKNYTSENNSLPNYADETDMNDLIIKEPFGTLVFTLSFTGIGL